MTTARLAKTSCLPILFHIITLLFLVLHRTDGAEIAQNVYVQPDTTAQHLNMAPLPALDDFTYCFWLKFADNVNTYSYFIALAAAVEHNCCDTYRWGWQNLQTTERSMILTTSPDLTTEYITQLPITSDEEAKLINGWHKHCVVNKHNGSTPYNKWFMDIDEPGILVELRSAPELSSLIKSGAYLSLMMEQDQYGGGFQSSQVLAGELSMFNMWNYAMDLDQLNDLGCDDIGNVVSMDGLSYEGGGELEFQSAVFNCSDDDVNRNQQLCATDTGTWFCRLKEKSLTGAVLSKVDASEIRYCAFSCIANELCRSANFISSNSSCELNTISHIESPTSLVTIPGTIYLSLTPCP